MRRPDFLLIGSNIADATVAMARFYANFYETLKLPVPPMALMTCINAEISKLAVNCAVTTKISLANSLANLCEAIPGADAHVVCNAVGMDSRIGKKYLQAGAAYGGPCFPRDGRAMLAAAAAAGVQLPLATATDRVNEIQIDRIVGLIEEMNPAVAAVLGTAYKTNTTVTEESAGLLIAALIDIRGSLDVRTHDPQAECDTQSVDEAIADADVVVITTPWPEYYELRPEQFKAGARIIDCWGILPARKFSAFDLIVTGVGPKK
jgi:UDPglucose 6-dehydrogenase